MLKSGDFPGFYVLPYLLDHGQVELLYDAETQRSVENLYWPSFDGKFYMSVYPPYDALLFSPLTWFDPQISRLVFTLFSFSCYVLSIILICRFNPSLSGKYISAITLPLALAPLMYAIFGGQNTSWSMLLYSLIIYLFSKRTSKINNFLIGACAGLWCYKPQFGLIVCALLFLTFDPWIIVGILTITSGYYLAGISVHGIGWPEKWLAAIKQFAPQNWISNNREMASLVGGLKSLLYSDNPPDSLSFPVACAWVVIAVALSYVGYLLHSAEVRADKESDKSRLSLALLLLGPILVLCSPQTLFYDLGFLIIPLLICVPFTTDLSINIFLLVAVLLGPITFYKSELPFTIFPIFALGALLVIINQWRKSSRGFLADLGR